MKPNTEFPLFAVDPKDGRRKMIGTKQVYDEGVVWYKKLEREHVMRLGSLGFDAATYDTQFAGSPGSIRASFDDNIYVVDFSTFEAHRTEQDYGHGRQYFLALNYWTKEPTTTVSPVRGAPPITDLTPTLPLVFGEVVLCGSCHGVGRNSVGKSCRLCGGKGYALRPIV